VTSWLSAVALHCDLGASAAVAVGEGVGLGVREGVGLGVGLGVGEAVGDAVGLGVGDAVRRGVGDAVGDTVGLGVGDAVRLGVGEGLAEAVGDGFGELVGVGDGVAGAAPATRSSSAAFDQGPRFADSVSALRRTKRAMTEVNLTVCLAEESGQIPCATGAGDHVTPSLETSIWYCPMLPLRPVEPGRGV
jgi:hypothetical protein